MEKQLQLLRGELSQVKSEWDSAKEGQEHLNAELQRYQQAYQAEVKKREHSEVCALVGQAE